MKRHYNTFLFTVWAFRTRQQKSSIMLPNFSCKILAAPNIVGRIPIKTLTRERHLSQCLYPNKFCQRSYKWFSLIMFLSFFTKRAKKKKKMKREQKIRLKMLTMKKYTFNKRFLSFLLNDQQISSNILESNFQIMNEENWTK